MMQPTADQILMRDNAVRLLGDGAARTRAAADAWPHVDRATWTAACAAGWPALLLPEDAGGWGCGAADMVAVLDAIASALPPEPIAPAFVVAPLLARCGTPDADELLRQMLAGETLALVAGRDPFPLAPGAHHVLFDAQWADVAICAEGTGADFRLLAARAADLDAAFPLRRTIDGSAQRVFSPAPGCVRELARGVVAERAYASACNLLRLGAAASLAGIARGALDLTVDYIKTRRQFGQPIGSFQALQHRAASMHVACAAASALVREAALAFGGNREHVACAMAKSKASRMAQEVVKECVQMHGAIGFSDEYVLSLYFRKAVTLASAFGTAGACARDIADVAGDTEAEGRQAHEPLARRQA